MLVVEFFWLVGKAALVKMLVSALSLSVLSLESSFRAGVAVDEALIIMCRGG